MDLWTFHVISPWSENAKEYLLLYGDSRFDENRDIILKATINYLKNIERFYGSFFY